MGETFFININCSSILLDSQETRYTMFIDSDKLSIVYELVEWIRWIFSVESCIYLTHEDSVIHELEDIRVLSKLKDFKIKPCGRPFCVHKNMYRTLLNKLNLFVNWNDTRVHKYFLEKLNHISGNITEEKTGNGNLIKQNNSKNRHSFMETEYDQNSRDTISQEKPCDNQLLNSNVNGYPLHGRKTLTDDAKPESDSVSKSSYVMNSYENKKNSEDNLSIQFENSSDGYNGTSDLEHRNIALNNSSYSSFCHDSSPQKSRSEFKAPTLTKNFKKTNFNRRSRKFVRPFSLGEILSNLRKDIEKDNVDDDINKKSLLQSSVKEENFNETATCENVLETETIRGKKRQRTRKRKKTKKQELENEQFMSPIIHNVDFTKNFNVLNSTSSLKPNHIRFDVEDEGDVMDTVENEFEVIQKVIDSSHERIPLQDQTLPRIETDNCQNFSNNITNGSSECKMETQTMGNENEVIKLSDGACNNNLPSYNADKSFETNSEDLNVFVSLKEKLKNSVVVKRFY